MTSALATGTRLLVAGKPREALAHLRLAVVEAPSHAAHHNLAVALRTQGDVEEALAHATAAIEHARSATTLALVGSLRDLTGDHAGALDAFRSAVSLDPSHDVSAYYLAICVAREGDRASAIERLRALLAGDARLPRLVVERARAQLSDLLATEGPLARDQCSVPLVAEIVAAAPASEPATSHAPGVGRAIELAEATAVLRDARRIVALTGAGISSASGLATRKELWRRHDRDSAVSIARFRRDPLPLWTVIREFLGSEPIAPNAAHRALAVLPRLATVVTQNVEGLHQAAGTSCDVIELHGTLLETRCDACGARGPACASLVERGVLPPPCDCGGMLRPDVVLFGEWVERARLERAAIACASCDVLLVVGTAADVAPAADLPMLAAAHGATIIEVKRTASRLVRAAGALHLAGTAEDLLPRIAEALA